MRHGVLFVLISVSILSAKPALVEAATPIACEDLFAPRSIVARVLQHRKFKRLLEKQTPEGKRKMMAGALKPALATEEVAPAKKLTRKKIDLPARWIEIENAKNASRILWISEQKVLVQNDEAVDLTKSVRLHSVQIADVASGTVDSLRLQQHELGDVTLSGDFILKTPFLIAAEIDGVSERPTYRFLHKNNLSEVRDAAGRITEFFVRPDLISFTQDGVGRLRLLQQELGETGNFEWFDRSLPFGKVVAISSGGAVVDVLERHALRKRYRYNEGWRAYEAIRSQGSFYTVKSQRTGVYRIYDTDRNEEWSIGLVGRAPTHTIVLRTLASTLENTEPGFGEVVAIFGSADDLQVILRYETFLGYEPMYYQAHLGSEKLVVITDEHRLGSMTDLGYKKLLFKKSVPDYSSITKNGGGGEIGMTHFFKVVDLTSGVIYDLSNQHQVNTDTERTALVGRYHYANIDVYTGPSGKHNIIRIYELKTGDLVRTVKVDGDARMIDQTGVARVQSSYNVEFIHVMTGKVLWVGSESEMPRLSPDAKRIASIRKGSLVIEELTP